MEAPTVENLLDALLPKVVTAAMHTTAISARSTSARASPSSWYPSSSDGDAALPYESMRPPPSTTALRHRVLGPIGGGRRVACAAAALTVIACGCALGPSGTATLKRRR